MAIPISKLIEYMDKAEKLNDGNLASCWVGLRMTLEMEQTQIRTEDGSGLAPEFHQKNICGCYHCVKWREQNHVITEAQPAAP